MNAQVDDSTLVLISFASVLFFIAVGHSLYVLIGGILAPQVRGVGDWHHDKPRWDRLRGTSTVFRNGERWIIGLSKMLEFRTPWFGGVPIRKDIVGRVLVKLFVCMFGDPYKIRQAVSIGSSKQPWSHFEVVASAMLTAAISGGTLMLVLIAKYPIWVCILLGLAAFVVAVHAYRWYFIHGRDRRRRDVRRFLPHAMDTVAMVMSSGDPFTVSLDAVIRDFPDEPLSQELAVMQNNLKRGQTMDVALATLSDTICLPEFREMVRVLSRIQDHGGAGAADFTRLARQLRIAQLRYMEEEVGKAEAAMEIPVLLVMFSAMLVSVAPFLLALMQSDLMK